jgi:hypothetical protein
VVRSVLAPRVAGDHSRAVPETLNPARRWNSFVCPGCRFVFRVPQDHDGKGVVCPACRIMLRLPGPEDETPPLKSEGLPEGAGELEEIEAGNDDDMPAGGSDWKFLLGLAVPAIALLALFAWWMAPDDSSPPVIAQVPPVVPGDTAGEIPQPAPQSMVLEIESVVKAFLGASSEEEVLLHVRQPDRTAPKLKAWLAGKPYVAPGFREMIGDSVSATGDKSLLTVTVRTGDFELRQIVLLESEGTLKVDWESWAGWSEMTWKDFQATRPEDGKWFRVELSAVDYYNFDFKDEDQWVSYRLDSPDGKDSLYGYVPRNGGLDQKIRPFEENLKVRMLLKLKFPAGGTSGNQVVIEAVTGQEWVELPVAENP